MSLPLYEQHRPTKFSDIVGQDEAVQRLENIGKRGYGGQAIWISGLSGSGKTTLARIVANEIADEHSTIELVADDLSVERLREIESTSQTYGFGSKAGRAIIINESHGLRANIVRRLLVTLERIPKHVCWIFTTTNTGEMSMMDGIDAKPLISRCLPIKLDDSVERLAEPFADWARTVAIVEGWVSSESTLEEFKVVARKTGCNLREMLQLIACGCV